MSNESIKAKFEVAQELINQHKYDEARAVLKTISHTKAREWETRLDKITQKTKRGTRIKLALIAIGIIIVVMFFVLDNKRASDNMAAFKQQQASDQKITDLQSCILQYPNNSLLVQACMTRLGH